MAKGAFLAVKRGKLGDSVGYNVTNSNNKDKQGWRIYQPVVRNPQTDGQMVQRIKLTAVNNLYRSLKEVIKRGFEGKAYGDPSRRAWLKMALGQSFDAGPWLPKSSQVPAPIMQVPLTVGSLRPVVVQFDPDDGYYYSDIVVSQAFGESSTISDLSLAMINAGYQAGDQVTVITGRVAGGTGFEWDVRSFIIDPQDTRTGRSLGFYFDYLSLGAQGYMATIYGGFANPGACAIAVSRDGDGVYLRSTSYLAVGDAIKALYYGPAMYIAAKVSYMVSAAKDTNWPIQPSRAGVASYTTTAADGTPVTLAGVSQTDGYWVVVSDAGEEYFVKCTDTRNAAYNAYLVGKTGSALRDVWNPTAPAGATSDSTVNFYTASDATENQLNLYYFLLSQGFDARGLLGVLPNT